ncbi:S8 family serine peptidase [Streptomyces sp. NPDC089919]|uniref:S8 family serine peptidase n=1 Tax=Streptomyces sp. NPDC089919 TaxID=3155188 RepID=UPI00342815B0
MGTQRRRHRRLFAPLVSLTATVAALTAATGTGQAATPAPSPAGTGTVRTVAGARAVPGSYLVVLKDGLVAPTAVPQTAADLTTRYGGRVRHVWQAALHGFAVRMSAAEAARLAADPRVSYVQQDAEVHALGTQPNPPSWGLDRIDQRDRPLDGSYSYAGTAPNVNVYIVDTGIRTTHTTFGGRAVWGHNSVDADNTDCNGHGTHVAGTVGGSQYGVAKDVRLTAVKVLNCAGSGTTAGLVDGLNWVAANAVKPAVVNLSLGYQGIDATADAAVRNTIATGVTFAIASGNSGADACNYSPAHVGEAITVNATDSGDNRASFSNWGTCTDIFAPGVAITSSWNTSDTATNSLQGTSMATPHVAGAAALYLSTHPADTPAQVQAALVAAATPNRVLNPGAGSPNLLLYTGGTASGGVSVANPGDRTDYQYDSVSFGMSASGGTAPYTWSAVNLPTGATINSGTGVISGTLRGSGTRAVTVTATDRTGAAGSTTFNWKVIRDACPRC